DPGPTGQVDLLEGRVSVARHVGETASREVRARQRTRIRLVDPRYRSAYRGALGDIAASGVEDDHVRRTHAGTKRLQCSLSGLVRRLAWDGRALIPARRELPGGDATDDRQHEPGDDHRPAVAGGQLRKTPQSTCSAGDFARGG